MNIGVDAREIQAGVVTGIGRSLANFIKYFSENEQEHQLYLFSERTIPLRFSGPIHPIVVESAHTTVWDQISIVRSLKAHGIDLFYSPYYKVPLSTTIPVVNQVLDLMYLIFPKYRKNLSLFAKIYYAVFGRVYCLKSINTITDSDHAKSDIIKTWKLKPSKVTVIPLGVSNRYRPVNNSDILRKVKDRFGLPDKYILYLGNFKPHKNVERLVKAYKKIGPRIPDYRLVLAGPMDERGVVIQKLVDHEGIRDRVCFTGTVKEDDYPEAIYSMAAVFVFPTLYEGFGLPPLEAMACGIPVVASNRTSVPEVVGDGGWLIDPRDTDAMGEAIIQMLMDDKIRNRFIQKGLRQAQRFDEERTAGELHHHLRQLGENFV